MQPLLPPRPRFMSSRKTYNLAEGQKVGAKVARWVDIPVRDGDATKAALLERPLAIAMNVRLFHSTT